MVAIIGILRSLGCAVTLVAPGAGFGGPEVEAIVQAGVQELRIRSVLTCDLTKEYVAINGDYRS